MTKFILLLLYFKDGSKDTVVNNNMPCTELAVKNMDHGHLQYITCPKVFMDDHKNFPT